MSSDQVLSVAVFGAGAFGRNHLRVYRQLEQSAFGVRLAAVAETDPVAADMLRQQGDLAVFSSPEACLEACRAGKLHLDAVSICVPTSAHYAVATQALAQGLDVLLEKPIAVTLAEADALVGQAAATRRILQVGLLERFNPAVTAAEPLVNGPMFFEAHRLSVFHRRALDVDVVLDLMIHDLDIVLHLAGEAELEEIRAAGISILSEKVDIGNVRLQFRGGCVANLTASRVSTERIRKLRLFQPQEYISLDYGKQHAVRLHVGADRQISFAELPAAKGEPLALQFEAFLSSVETRSEPKLSGVAARRTLEVALAILDKMKEHSQIVSQSLVTGWTP
jgi:predicted dehydrogenase